MAPAIVRCGMVRAMMKIAMPAKKVRRRPRMSPARAPSSSSPPKVKV
jgi:hypothetical protein